MSVRNISRLPRILLIQFTILGLVLAPGVLAQSTLSDIQFQSGRVLIQAPLDTIEVDRDAATMWINRQAITMDRGFLEEIQAALKIVARDPGERGIREAAATLSHETVAKLQVIRDALNRPEDLIALSGFDQCGPTGIGWGLTAAGYFVACAAAVAATGGGAAPCFIAIAAWTASTWALANCLGNNMPRRGGGRGGHDDDGPHDSDGDGTPDAVDGCPFDAGKTEAGECGCGAEETDSDFDGTPDCVEECLYDDCEDDEDDCTPVEILMGTCRTGPW